MTKPMLIPNSIKNTRIFKQGGLKSPKNQNAYILMLSIVLLLAMLIASLNFFEQSTDNIQISGYNRDSSESLLFAESAMNTLYGRFVFDKDLDNDGKADNTEKLDIDNPGQLPLHYSYFITNGNGIDQALPSMLQRIANGEARNNGSSGTNNTFSINQNEILVENLFTQTAKPILFEFDAQNKLIISNKNWTDLSSGNSKTAAAWLELVRNPELAGTIQVYVQSIAKVGNSKSYVQRLIGTYPNTLGIKLGGINESSL